MNAERAQAAGSSAKHLALVSGDNPTFDRRRIEAVLAQAYTAKFEMLDRLVQMEEGVRKERDRIVYVFTTRRKMIKDVLLELIDE